MKIDILHLLWIVPVSASFGAVIIGICRAGKIADDRTYDS